MSAFSFRLSPVLRISLLVLACAPMALLAGDIVPPKQLAGDHSSIPTTSKPLRDDAFADAICDKIQKNANGKVKDVKFMINSCYGGGMLDDLDRVFGPGGKCDGVKWVAGAASAADQTAQGWGDSAVNATSSNGLNLGSTWTDALAGKGTAPGKPAKGGINGGNSSDNVLDDLKFARDHDDSGPKGDKTESPQVAAGNGGDKITWNMPGAKHEAIVFGGLQTNVRHNHNIQNVAAALDGVWGSAPHNIQKIDGGSKKDLLDALDTATKRLDANTELVIYIDDHGSTTFDFMEAINAIGNLLIDKPTMMSFDLPGGWFTGYWGNYFTLESIPNPMLYMTLANPVPVTDWHFYLNGAQLSSEATGMLSGEVSFYVNWQYLVGGHNILQFEPTSQNKASAPLDLTRLELDAGPVNELDHEQILLPGQSAAYFDINRDGEGVFVELLDQQKAVVYMFSYLPDGSGQAWMIGVGQQSTRGIIVTDMLMPTGGKFGPNFDPADITNNPWGSAALVLPQCGTNFFGELSMSPIPDNGFEHFDDFSYQRLTTLAGCNVAAKAQTKATGSGLSGSWFDPTHNGEGIIVEVLTDGSAVVQWFTYDQNGKQFWIQGTGNFNGSVLTVDNLFSTSGKAWGSGFGSGPVMQDPWGTLTMDFTACDAATVNYDSSAGFGSGTLNMVRLTSLMGIPCS